MPRETSHVLALDTLRLIKWAAQQTGHVAYRQDYLPHGHDATIMMGKPRHGKWRQTV